MNIKKYESFLNENNTNLIKGVILDNGVWIREDHKLFSAEIKNTPELEIISLLEKG